MAIRKSTAPAPWPYLHRKKAVKFGAMAILTHRLQLTSKSLPVKALISNVTSEQNMPFKKGVLMSQPSAWHQE
ncbi:hypothetical protein NG99_03260 [Erwinia typographi]|uniref:Uncharacterized protein n=1 Tax=Erwinia typographi TaxID=371042 RepID=A0A0A4ACH0_9GAMM|nr:hypothetical protein NG99_03260 [Erwinia typographi]